MQCSKGWKLGAPPTEAMGPALPSVFGKSYMLPCGSSTQRGEMGSRGGWLGKRLLQ